MKIWAILVRVLAAIALVAYPAFVWIGLSSGSPRQVAIVLLCVMVPAMLFRAGKGNAPKNVRGLAAVPATILLILVVAALLDGSEYILATPVATNVVLLLSFGITLRPGSMPMIERFARLQEKELDRDKQAWCRMWTWIWCAFFVANGTTAALLAIFADMKWWALYNGLLCYALIGSLFAIEWLLRRVRFPDVRKRKTPDETA
ncbi:MAG: hypothetical protein ACE37K_00115 [Planctomycetota bacterium]